MASAEIRGTVPAMKAPLSMLFLSTCALAAPASAADRYRFDTVHSQVAFHVSHLGFTHSEGEFHDISGSFNFAPDAWNEASCDVQIGVASIDLDDAAWNRKMLGRDWFDVDQHPTMHFRCLQVHQVDGNKGRIDGELTLRGITLPVTLDVQFNRAGLHKYSLQYVAGFSATTTIRRSAFGMLKYIPEIGDDISIRLEIEGIREGKKRDRKK